MTGNDRAGVAAAQKTVLQSTIVMPGIRLMISFVLVLWIAISCSSETSNPPANPPAPPDEAAALNALKEVNRARSDFIRRTRRYAQRTDELIAVASAERATNRYRLYAADAARSRCRTLHRQSHTRRGENASLLYRPNRRDPRRFGHTRHSRQSRKLLSQARFLRTRSGHMWLKNLTIHNFRLSHDASSRFLGRTVETTKATTANAISAPVWCYRCSIKIAPYGLRAVYHGKLYHRDCYAKINNEKAQARKN